MKKIKTKESYQILRIFLDYLQRYLDFLIVALAFIIIIYLNYSVLQGIVFSAFIFYVLRPYPSKILVIGCAACLSMLPFLVIIHRTEVATELASIAYYLLSILIVAKLYELKDKKNV